MNCPRCHLPLAPASLEAGNSLVEAMVCGQCGGQWFDAGKLESLTEEIELVLFEFRHLPSHEQQMAPMICPRCTAQAGPADSEGFVMQKKTATGRDSHVIMDVCDRCLGTWLDAGELTAIQQDGLLTALVHLVRWMRQN